MDKIDDVTLIAYTDGELDPATCAEVETVLAHDAELRAKVRSLRESAALVSSAFNHALYVPPSNSAAIIPLPAISAQHHPVTATGNVFQHRRPFVKTLSLVASLATLVIGILFGHYATQDGMNGELQHIRLSASVDDVAIQRALMYGMEKELSGTPVTWENPDTGDRGTITPVRTFKSVAGHYCREFVDVRVIAGATHSEGGVACRYGEGVWHVRLRYFPERNGI